MNTAAFVDGISRATYQAKAGATQIASALQGVGRVVGELGSNFGQFGTIVGTTLSSVGANIGKLVKSVGDLSGSAGGLKLAGVGLVALAAGAATAGAALAAIAVHASETGEKLYNLSQATGVSVQDLSGLSIVGKIVGVELDTLARGLERLDRNALQASLSPQRTTNAFRQLGIQVTDTSGHLKSTTELFTEVSDKFSAMQDGATKTALAMQLFGRAGAELIPVLNQGGSAIKEWIDYGTRVGAVMTDQMATGAHAFQVELVKLDLIQTGVQNGIMNALLPAIEHITESVATFLETGNNIQKFGDIAGKVLTQLASWTYDVIYAWDFWVEKITIVGAEFDKFNAKLSHYTTGLGKKYVDQIVADANAAIAAAKDTFAKQDFSIASGQQALWGPIKPVEPGLGSRTGEPPTPQQPAVPFRPEPSQVQDLLDKTQLLVAAEIANAQAIGKGTAAILLEKATTEALTKIEETRASLVQKITDLQDEQKSEEAAGAKAKVAAIKEQLDGLEKQLTLLDQSKQKITALYDTKGVAAFATSVGDALEKQNEDLKDQVAAQQEGLAGGPTGSFMAGIESKLSKDKQQVQELTAVYQALGEVLGVDQDQLNALGDAIAAYSAQVDKHRALEITLAGTGIADAMQKQNAELQGTVTAGGAAARAAQQGGQASVQAGIEEKLAKEKEQVAQVQAAYDKLAASQDADQADLDQLSQVLGTANAALDKHRQLLEEEHANTIATEEAHYNLKAQYADEALKLHELMNVAKANNDVMAQMLLKQEQVKQLQDLSKQIEQTQMKFGSFGVAFRAWAQSLIQTGSQLRATFFQDLQQGFDGLEDSIAKFITTGRGGLLMVLQQLEQALIKLALQFLISAAMQKIFGAAATAVQSASLGTSQAVKQEAIGQAAAEAAASVAWAGPEAAIAAAVVTEAALEGITFAERGADVVPGRAYIVGERRPELFVAGTSGHIYPQLNPSDESAGSAGGGKQPLAVHLHNSVTTFDKRGVRDVFRNSSDMFAGAVADHLRRNNIRAYGRSS